MNWKELIGGMVVTALMVLFTLWTTEGEIGTAGGVIAAMVILFVMSCAWRMALNRFFTNDGLSWERMAAYSLGALIASVSAVMYCLNLIC